MTNKPAVVVAAALIAVSGAAVGSGLSRHHHRPRPHPTTTEVEQTTVVTAPPGPPGPHPTTPIVLHCGVERWSVKTGTDAGARLVNPTSQPSTIAALDALPAPSQPAARLAPTETTTFTVHATLTGYKAEADSDYHLILSDGGQTMIAEIPAPSCVGPGSPFAAQIAQARAAFDSHFQAGPAFAQVSIPVTVTGVGFFDFKHGQAGVAPNAAELHPVLAISF